LDKLNQAKSRTSLRSFTTLRGSLRDLAIVSLFLNGLSLALPLLILQIYDRILPNAGLGTLTLLVLGVMFALVCEAILRLGRAHVTGWIGARFEHRAGCEAFKRVMSSNIQDFARDGSGVHVERMNALSTVKDFYAGQALLSLLDLPFVVLYLGLIWYLGGIIVVVPVVTLLLFGLCAIGVGVRLHGAVRDRMIWDDRRFNFIIEVLSGIHTIKAMAMEAPMMRRYERLLESCTKGDHRTAMSSAAALNTGAFFSELTMVAVVGFGAMLALDGRLTVGGLAACTLLAGRSLQPLQRAMGIWTRFQSIRLARRRVKQVFDMPAESTVGGTLEQSPDIAGGLELDSVTFGYDDTAPPVIRDASIQIEPGACVGISGGNASGKSTLLGLMLGALRPEAGFVSLDGHDIASFEPAALKRRIAYLPQNAVVFKGSIMDNVTMFDPALADRAIEVAGDLGLDSVIEAMPLGWESIIGDAALDAMPRGIKQRIAIARGLVHDPRIILFDEANMAIDGGGDAYLRDALEKLKGRCTMILVTYRPSLLKLADAVYELEDGALRPREDRPPTAPPAPVTKPALAEAEA
jgi:ATP-binding cassette subfamily C protein LapB